MKVLDGRWFDIKVSLAPAWSAIIVLVTECITEICSWNISLKVQLNVVHRDR